MSASKLSVILLSYQSAARLVPAVNEITEILEKENIDFEIIVIDDGSTDLSYKIACDLEAKDHRIKAFALAKNYTSPYAQFAGLSVCTGDCAAPMPDDLQRPLSHLVEMYRAWEKGNKIIIGHRKSRSDGVLSDLFSAFYYKMMNAFSDIRFPRGGSDGYLIDREIIDVINQNFSKRNTTPTIELLHMGYHPLLIAYDRPPNNNFKSRWTFRKKMKLAVDTFFGRSNSALRMITYIGIFTFVASVLLIIAIVLSKIFSDNTLFGFPIQGWATLVVLITMFNGLMILCIGIVAEYIWRIYEEVKGRPAFLIRKKNGENEQ